MIPKVAKLSKIKEDKLDQSKAKNQSKMQKVNQQQQQQQHNEGQVSTGSGINRSQGSFKLVSMLLFGILACLVMTTQVAQAGQGCPFDDGSCREYCNQQGCNMGYCGHFAWIQCICRKCGDEWSWYDKVRYNPDKTVNQTELDSLKLNGTAPIIITNSSNQQQQQQVLQTQTKPAENKQQTLTTLLIPDLSETNGKLDLNDIPDENSDKFLDYLAKNHEKLVQATAVKSQEASAGQNAPINQNKPPTVGGLDLDTEEEQEEQENQTPSSEETVEIQISTSNNNAKSATSTSQVAPVLDQHSEILLKKLLKIANSERHSEIDWDANKKRW